MNSFAPEKMDNKFGATLSLFYASRIEMKTTNQGFSRSELVVTVVIFVITVGLLLPWITRQRGKSQRNFCESRQMVIAKAVFLKAVDSPNLPGYRDIQATIGEKNIETSWIFPTLPYIHPLGSALADEIRLSKIEDLLVSENIDLFRNGEFSSTLKEYGNSGELIGEKVPIYIPDLVCPQSDRVPKEGDRQPLTYVANCGMPDRKTPDGKTSSAPPDFLANGVFFDRISGGEIMDLDFLYNHDGLNDTIMLSENLNAGECFDSAEEKVGFVWIDSFSKNDDGTLFAELDTERLLGINQRSDGNSSMKLARPSGNHVEGVNVAFCDGATKFLNSNIDYEVYVQFLTSSCYEVRNSTTGKLAEPPYRLERE